MEVFNHTDWPYYAVVVACILVCIIALAYWRKCVCTGGLRTLEFDDRLPIVGWVCIGSCVIWPLALPIAAIGAFSVLGVPAAVRWLSARLP